MDDIWLGCVLTVIEDRAIRFNVTCIQQQPSSSDKLLLWPYKYYFDVSRPADQQESRYIVRVEYNLAKSPYGEDNERKLYKMHNETIKYALWRIQNNPVQKEIDFTPDDQRIMNEQPLLAGAALREKILRFMYVFFESDAEPLIGRPDLEDNFHATWDEIKKWMGSLKNEGFVDLVDGAGKQYRINRNQVRMAPYRLNGLRKREIGVELGQLLAEQMGVSQIDPSNHKYFKLIDLGQYNREPFAFVLMPFKEEEFPQDIMGKVFIPVVKETLGIACLKNDDNKLPNYLEGKIYSHIVRAKVVIADVTTENTNVMYEFGMAMALEKITILTFNRARREGGKKLAFDFAHYEHESYENYDELIAKLKDRLANIKDHL